MLHCILEKMENNKKNQLMFGRENLATFDLSASKNALCKRIVLPLHIVEKQARSSALRRTFAIGVDYLRKRGDSHACLSFDCAVAPPFVIFRGDGLGRYIRMTMLCILFDACFLYYSNFFSFRLRTFLYGRFLAAGIIKLDLISPGLTSHLKRPG